MIVSKKESEEEVVVGSFREGKNAFWYDVWEIRIRYRVFLAHSPGRERIRRDKDEDKPSCGLESPRHSP